MSSFRLPARSSSRTFRVTVTAAAAIAAVAAIAGLTSASGAPAPAAAQAAAPSGSALEWVAVKSADTQPKTLTLGASWVTHLEVHQSEDGKPGRTIGDGSAKCSVVDVTSQGAITQCQRVLRTAGGDLALSAMIDRFGAGPYTGDSAIVGGTGDYAGAGGEARITLDGKLVRFTLHLDR
ncbi:hypothetical protein OG552_18880 [Streptomyces sp. NBC_01476]|uniref:hypothetical protein n=1 Tax=Streptomyces sp. NBC_01476 TaxID=2903881 RepID=UPI002E31F4DD|nr:hypothetical protein [Streptomyces sp. NBC_01476]